MSPASPALPPPASPPYAVGMAIQGDMGPGSASAAAGSGSASPPTVEQYRESVHSPTVSWHLTLNNHASTRPKEYGGKLVPAVTQCKTFTPPGDASGVWRCVLDLPNSFESRDGLQHASEGEGATKVAASEQACRLTFTRPLMERPGLVVLRPVHRKSQ